MTLSKLYNKEIFDNLGYHAAWLPNTVLKLGDIGYIKNNQFEYVFSLGDLNISYEATTETASADYEYTSKSGVSITSKLAGNVPSVGSFLTESEAGVSLEFQAPNAIVFQAGDCEILTIKNKNKLAADIIPFLENDQWSSDYVVITTLVKSKSATVLVSNESGGKVELAAQAGTTSSIQKAATLKTSNQLKFASKVGIQIIAASDLTPLYKVSGFKKGFFSRKPIFRNRGESTQAFDLSTPVSNNDNFVELNPEELEEMQR